MIEVKLLVDCIDYDSVVDLLMPVVGDKLQVKGGIVGKIGGKKEKLTKMAHKLLGKVSQEKKDQTIVDLATKKQAMIVEKVSAVAAKKGIGVQICDISVRKI